MENISQQQIAKLVLGYLKYEKSKKAFRHFLENSPYLHKYLKKVKRRRPISTRVAGLSLVDIIKEYSSIYRMVQERLEATNYFNFTLGRSTLEEQLTYLLNRVQYSPSSSPCSFNSRSSSSEKDVSYLNTSCCIAGDVKKNGSKNKIKTTKNKVLNSEVCTTSSSSLPGSSNNKSTDSVELMSPKENLDLSVDILSLKLLENREFQEKLAENINKEVLTISNTQTDKQNTYCQELDNVIKTIIQKTEADPIFDKLLFDIIGQELSDSVDSLKRNVDNESVEDKTTKPNENNSTNTNSDKNPDLNNKKSSEIATTSNYLGMALSNALEFPLQTKNVPQQIINPYLVPTPTMQSISSTVSTFVSSASHQAPLLVQNSQNQGLLMVQQPQVDTSKSYFVVDNQQLVNFSQPPKPMNEQDIMAMPTLFVCDNQQLNNSQLSLIQPNTFTTVTSDFMEVAPSVSQTTKSMPHLSAAKVKKNNEKKKLKTLEPKILPKPAESGLIFTINTKVADNTVSDSIDKVIEEKITEEPYVTTPVITEKKSSKKASPKSNSSHVRQLDFSTPEKINLPEEENNDEIIKEAKDTVETKKNNDKKKSWDADLRAIAGVKIPDLIEVKKVPKKVNSKKTLNTQKDKQRKNKMAKIEEDVKDEQDDIEQKENCVINNDVNSENNDENEQVVKTDSTEIVSINKSPINEEVDELTKTENTENNNDVVGSENLVKLDCVVINLDLKPTYRKKCNIGNSKKTNVTSGVASVNGNASINNKGKIEEVPSTLVLSPTKLNANKRSIVAVENNKETDEEQVSSSDKRNVIPNLETPLKNITLPTKPPHFLSPVNVSDTPFTKVLKQELNGFDLNSFPTPKFPLTPTLSISPLAFETAGYSRRSTDYSTSSSYYHPSDTEQSKSIEQILIEESLRIENVEKSKIPTISNVENLNLTKSTLNDRKKSFDSALTGKKNLQLIKNHIEDVKSDSSDSNSSCENSTGWVDNQTNDTVILKTVPYSLRSRGSVPESKTDDCKKQTSSKNIELQQTLDEKRKGTISKIKEEESKKEKQKSPRTNKNKKNQQPKSSTESIINNSSSKNETAKETKGDVVDKTEDKKAGNDGNVVKSENIKLERKQNKTSKIIIHSVEVISEKLIIDESSKVDEGNKKNSNDEKEQELKINSSCDSSKNLKQILNDQSNVIEDHKTWSSPIDEIDLYLSSEDSFDRIIDQIPEPKDLPKHHNSLLEPFELVQTQLKECSSDCGENKPESEKYNQENAKNKLEKFDDPEILVKELKERGIHLVPARNAKKSADKVNKNKEISKVNKNKEITKVNKNKEISKVNKKKEIPKLKSKLNVTKKVIESLNNSLEEGEIVSDTETSKNKTLKSKDNTKSRRDKHEESSLKKREIKDSKAPTKSSKKSSKVQLESLPKEKSLSEKPSTSKIESNVKSVKQAPKTEKVQNALEEFQTKIFYQETLRVVHEESKKTNKKKYDLELLQKKISANVYIEELDSEVEKQMSFVPLKITFDMPSTVNVLIPRKVPKESVLDKLYKNLVNDSQNSVCFDDVYSPEKTGLYKKKSITNCGNLNEKKVDEHEKIKEWTKEDIEKNLFSPASNSNDELMNYAIVGSQRIENDDLDSSDRKRKASVNVDEKPEEKKMKKDNCQELLKKIDVESFLKKLHGST